jgi:hypothetical protein
MDWAPTGEYTRMGNFRGTVPVRPGQVRRQELLGTVSVYRVVQVDESLALVEVIEAPGLHAGMQFSFTTEAVGRMDVVDSGEVELEPSPAGSAAGAPL